MESVSNILKDTQLERQVPTLTLRALPTKPVFLTITQGHTDLDPNAGPAICLLCGTDKLVSPFLRFSFLYYKMGITSTSQLCCMN